MRQAHVVAALLRDAHRFVERLHRLVDVAQLGVHGAEAEGRALQRGAGRRGGGDDGLVAASGTSSSSAAAARLHRVIKVAVQLV